MTEEQARKAKEMLKDIRGWEIARAALVKEGYDPTDIKVQAGAVRMMVTRIPEFK